MRARAFSIVFISLFAFLAGCRDEGMGIGGVPNPERIASAVSLSPGSTEILGSRLYGVNLIGRTAQCNFPNPNSKAEIIMKGVKPNYERIAELKPGIVVYDDMLFSKEDLKPIEDANIPTYAITGNTVEEFIQCLHQLGKRMNGETSLSEYADLIYGAMAVASGAPPSPKPKVVVMMPGGGAEHMIAGTKSFVADVVRKAQGDVIGPDADRFVPVSAEALVDWNPDVIVSAGDPASLLKDPRLQTLAAVKNNRVLPGDPDYLLRRGSRVDKLITGLYKFFIAS